MANTNKIKFCFLINYFFEDYSLYVESTQKTDRLSKDTILNVNYNFLSKIFSDLNPEQQSKLQKFFLDKKAQLERTG